MKRYTIAVAALIVTGVLLSAAGSAKQKQKEPVVPKKKINLFNGKDFTGWKLFIPDEKVDVSTVWSVKDGVIRCESQSAGYMRTEVDYADYHLHAEWRWPEEAGNNGILLHMSVPDKVWPKCIEYQLWATNAGDLVSIGGTDWKEYADLSRRDRNIILRKLKDSSEKPVGQWNECEIICKDDWIVVFVNGVLQNVATKTSVTSGKICLQSEWKPIEFRNVYIEPLE